MGKTVSLVHSHTDQRAASSFTFADSSSTFPNLPEPTHRPYLAAPPGSPYYLRGSLGPWSLQAEPVGSWRGPGKP